MSQIRDKKAHRKHIATMNPINAKSVQLIELHAFAYRLLSVYLSESFDFLKVNVRNVTVFAVVAATCVTASLLTTEVRICLRAEIGRASCRERV